MFTDSSLQSFVESACPVIRPARHYRGNLIILPKLSGQVNFSFDPQTHISISCRRIVGTRWLAAPFYIIKRSSIKPGELFSAPDLTRKVLKHRSLHEPIGMVTMAVLAIDLPKPGIGRSNQEVGNWPCS